MTEPPLAARKTTNLLEKSSPPVRRLIGGMITSLTSELTMEPNAAPMITPTARSTALPLTANSLNSFHIPSHDNVDQLSRHHDHVAHGLAGNAFVNFRIRQRGGFHLFVRCKNRHLHSITDLSVNLKDDFHFVFDKQPLIVSGPLLFGNIAACVSKLRAQVLP